MSNKRIDTLVTDIYALLDSGSAHTPDPATAAHHAMNIGGELAKATLIRDKPREIGKLWASDLGKPCLRQHWYNFNMPEQAEPLTGNTKFKFLYGNLIEEAVLYLGKEAGHSVEDQQAAVKHTFGDWEVSGRIDAVVDGVLVDVKSASTYSFNTYKEGITSMNDTFGYLWQLSFYSNYHELPSVTNDSTGFVWVDKTLGHIAYTGVASWLVNPNTIKARVADIAKVVEGTERMMPNRIPTKPYGKSGNWALDTACSYCAYKDKCWEETNNGKGLRTFLYSNRPVHLTDVAREPKVPELVRGDK